jgi:hypothetical protein
VSDQDIVTCTSCGNELGAIDRLTGALKLQKWSLALENETICSYPMEKWFTAQFAQAIESDGVRKFLVDAAGKDRPTLLVRSKHCVDL